MHLSSLGVVLLLLSLVCLGSWPALLRLCSEPLEATTTTTNHRQTCCFLKPQGRLQGHAYMDYAGSYVFCSILPVLLELLTSSSQNQDNTAFAPPTCLVALLGGILLSLGNLSMQWSTSAYGAPLTTVLALQASLTVIFGTFINYALEPQLTKHVSRLFGGVVCFLGAIAFASFAQIQVMQQQRQQHYESVTPSSSITMQVESIPTTSTTTTMILPCDRNATNMALGIATLGGVCFGFFSPCFNIAVNDPFDWNTKSNNQLSVAMANLWFALGFGISSLVTNVVILWKQHQLSSYHWSLSHERSLARTAGAVCALGNVLQFQGGKLTGYAAADLVQAFPLVATIWDVVLFGEFSHNNLSSQSMALLLMMYVTYMGGIAFMATSI